VYQTALLSNEMFLNYNRLILECELIQWRIQRGFHEFHGTPLLKGCLRKCYAQMYYW